MGRSTKPRGTFAARAAGTEAGAPRSVQCTAADLARVRNGEPLVQKRGSSLPVPQRIPLRATNLLRRADRAATRRRVLLCAAALVVLSYLALGVMGAQGQYYYGSQAYEIYSPIEVAHVLAERLYNALAEVTHAFDPRGNEWLEANVPGYWAIPQRAEVLVVTLLCAALLSVSGMLYQNTFRNPLAGPSLLGASSGVSLGLMILVFTSGATASALLTTRYLLCYGCGAAVLTFVLLAASRLSRRGQPLDTVNLILIGTVTGQLVGLVVSFVTLYVMDEAAYAEFYLLSQMLVVDTSALSWACLGIASALGLVPVFLLRYRMNALAFDEAEARLWGIPYARIRLIALMCGAVMMLAAQIHIGAVGLVTLVVPYLARGLFGCEFSKQLAGCVCLGMLLLIVCRLVTDLVPFVADGVAVGSVVSIAALPLVVLMATRGPRGWE